VMTINDVAEITAAEYLAIVGSNESSTVATTKRDQMPEAKVKLIQWLTITYGEKLVAEYRFHPTRKWRFDFVIDPDRLKVAVEYDGLMGGTAHRSIGMVAKDSSKINTAQTMGWNVVRVNAISLKDGSGYTAIERAVAQRTEGETT
jgi:very-short-patch-repair endonuclease